LNKNTSIQDLVVENLSGKLDSADASVSLLRFDDHLLRRFGQVDAFRKSPGELKALSMRTVADEIWILLEGRAACRCHDLRSDSPSKDTNIEFILDAPARVLIPFGVAFGWRAIDNPTLMLRLSTHQDGDHLQDQLIPLEDLG
jgi:dTDP-4-dehydrorhamnose 3,5-epimerase